MLKNGERRQYDLMCPFECPDWDECVCENTAIQNGDAAGPYFFGPAEIEAIQNGALP